MEDTYFEYAEMKEEVQTCNGCFSHNVNYCHYVPNNSCIFHISEAGE